eukprot:5885425-Prorocentrum_lima.AAC.1
MTSSLVGSEMCIRDRIKGDIKGIIALLVDDMIRAGAKTSNVELLKALGSCLLYTSDAADDM